MTYGTSLALCWPVTDDDDRSNFWQPVANGCNNMSILMRKPRASPNNVFTSRN